MTTITLFHGPPHEEVARANMRRLIDSDANKVTNVFSTLL